MSEIAKIVEEKLHNEFFVDIPSANELQIYHALVKSVNQILAHRRYENSNREKPKFIHYMSMEFLPGRALLNNLFNLEIEHETRNFLAEHGFNLDEIAKVEPDPSLGNGGLGRLASCYLDAMSTQNINATGYSILYEFGIFKQIIRDNNQVEMPDEWLTIGESGLIKRRDKCKTVKFYGKISEEFTPNGIKVQHTDFVPVEAAPYDLLISGFKTKTVNKLRLFKASAKATLNVKDFSEGRHYKASESEILASSISKMLYPADDTYEGKSLRLRQQYFFTSAALQEIAEKHFKIHNTFDNFADFNQIQINDTHPSLAIPEFMRILLDDYRLKWSEAICVLRRTFAYTNHTVLPEALERWPIELVRLIIPRVYSIVEEINRRFCGEIYQNNADLAHEISKVAIIQNGQINMANLCITIAHNVNGVSKLHSEIITRDLFNVQAKIFPNKFLNVTNGVAHRRWLKLANPALCSLICEAIGDEFLADYSKIENLLKFKDDVRFIEDLNHAKLQNKEKLAKFLSEQNGVNIDYNAIFDVQVKRMHEYKRQLLKIMQIAHIYLEIKAGKAPNCPKVFVFGAKAYMKSYLPKEVIRLINALAAHIRADKQANKHISVIFSPDYKVSHAEIIIPAADLSEQISCAGYEASGTGNMKFMMNGAITIGTLDGANVEINEALGGENIFIFGLKSEDVKRIKSGGYNPQEIYNHNENIRQVLNFIKNGIAGHDFSHIYNYLKNNDDYLCLADFDDYIKTCEKANDLYLDRLFWGKMSLINIAKSGIFSADRSVLEYRDKVWHKRDSICAD